MIIDFETNNEKLLEFVKKLEGFGGVIEKERGFFRMINLQTGYVDRFYERVWDFSKKLEEERKLQSLGLNINSEIYFNIIPLKYRNNLS